MKQLEIKYAPAIGLNKDGAVDYFWSDKPRELGVIDTVVIHSMWNPGGSPAERYDATACVALLMSTNEGYSCHYFIDKDGVVWQSVDEVRMAWHAGKSMMPHPDNRPAVNKFSVGVELIGNEIDGFTIDQYHSLVGLIAQMLGRMPIQNIVGHSDIAGPEIRPDEPKTDPWNFDWLLFATMLEKVIEEQFKDIKMVGKISR
jgi:N-acetyl-anhydromuramyl-L-alanine amidase AmpD